MISLTNINQKEKCTVIESIYGEVKLIKRSYESQPTLVTLNFSNLKECLDYVDKNQFQINILYSGRRKRDNEKE
jgi:hypothetical protein